MPHLAEFKHFLLERKLDFVGLCETWLHHGIPTDVLNIEGYRFLRLDRAANRGGGVGVFILNSIEFEQLHLNCSPVLEELWLKIKLKNKNIVIGTVYRPPASSVSDFLVSLENSLSQLHTYCHDLICGGDINIDLLNVENQQSQNFMKTIELFDLKQTINSPTRITKNTSTLIDVILVPSEGCEQDLFGTDRVNNLSDHFLVFGQSYFKNPVNNNKSIIRSRCLGKLDKESLLDCLSVTPLDDIFYINDPMLKVECFTQLILDLFDQLAPYKTLNSKRINQPWCSFAIQCLIKRKDQAYNKFKKSKTPANWNYYKYIKNETTSAINREKKAYLEHLLENNSDKGKKLWNTLRKLNILNKKPRADIPNNLNNPNDINDFFLQFSQLELPDPDLILFYTTSMAKNINDRLSFRLTDEHEVYTALSSVKSNAVGPDGLTSEMLKLCCPQILKFLVNIYNSCILSYQFPDSWKITKVFPLPKTKNEPTNFSELRPISILSPCSKIFEKILTARIIEHLNAHNILPLRQSGFRKGYSCCTALLDVVDSIMSSLDSGNSCVLVLLDYTRAFDKVNHQVLFALLLHIGLSQGAVDLIKSYLSNRVQYVETDKGCSDKGSLYSGVPQGSGLSPLLFCIYTCYLTHALEHCTDYSFADDKQLLYSVTPNNIAQAQLHIGKDLNQLVINSEKHHLKLNPLKTKVLAFGKQQNDLENQLKLNLNNSELSFVRKARNLGVILDTDLRFGEHVSACVQKAYVNLKLLYPHRRALNQNLKLRLSEALVLSHFNYCDALYGPCLTKQDRDRVQRVQRSCLRFVFGIRKFDPVIHKLKSCNWLDMENRRKLHSAVLFHGIVFNKTPPYLYNKIKFRADVHTLNLRFRGLLSPPLHKTALFTRSFSYNIYILYNHIPLELKFLRPASFKYVYKNILLRHS